MGCPQPSTPKPQHPSPPHHGWSLVLHTLGTQLAASVSLSVLYMAFSGHHPQVLLKETTQQANL